MARILVFGANGLLGTSLVPYLRCIEHDVVSQGRRPPADLCLDPTDQEAVGAALRSERPDVIVNLIAATNVDRCEERPSEAFLANVRVVEAIAAAMRATLASHRGHLIQISTDQVYDGPGPHREDDALPCNSYALTKYAGELAAARVGATVLRTNFVGRSRCDGRASLSDWIVGSLRAAKPITVFSDVSFSAWHISSLCALIGRIAANPLPGIFNAGCRDGISKADFACRLASILGLDSHRMRVGLSSEAAFNARRPLDMRMDVTRAEEAFGFNAPIAEREIQTTAEEYYCA